MIFQEFQILNATKHLTKNDEVPLIPIEANVGDNCNSVHASIEKENLPITTSVAERRDIVALNLTKSDEVPMIQTDANVGTQNNSVRASIGEEKLPVTTSVAKKCDVVALNLTKSDNVPIIQTGANVGADITPIRISIDKQRLKNTGPAKANRILEELDSLNMWWDTRDLGMANRHIEDELEDNDVNKENMDHACFKDDKIIEVSLN